MANQIVDREVFTANQVCKVFQLSATKQTLFNAEERGEIPCAQRVQRGKTSYRVWNQGQLAEIGSRMGFLHRPTSPRVVSVFSLKGGTSKSTMSFQLARSMALHGVRTLVIGLDTQQTVTQTLGKISGQAWEDDVEGVFHILKDGTDWITTVQKTDLSTLSYIPETVELAILDIWLKSQKRKEYILKERLVDPILASGQYDLVIFDCHPAWSEMVTGALAASHTLISPVGSDVNSFKAAK
ncbi:MAG: AAA family ATPase, partial [Bdellovibrionota bacterium]